MPVSFGPRLRLVPAIAAAAWLLASSSCSRAGAVAYYGRGVLEMLRLVGGRASPPASDTQQGIRMDRTTPPAGHCRGILPAPPGRLLLMLVGAWRIAECLRPCRVGVPFQLNRPGRPDRDRKELPGRPTLIFFCYTHCPTSPDVCCFRASRCAAAMARMPIGSNAYFSSVDPERDYHRCA